MNRYPDLNRSRIVLAGTSDYEYDNDLPRLPSVRNNLVGLEEAFTNPSTGVFKSENCTVIDTPDTPKSMMQRLRRAARETEDVFVCYYAGHGILGWGSKLYLSVRETDPHQPDGTAVPFEWVRDAIRESPADVRILILDCCFSGRAIGAMSSDSAALEQIKITGTTILTSTTANDISHAVPGERYTTFTAELIALLMGAHDDVLTVGNLYRPLSAAMARRGLPSPKNVVGDLSGDIILRRPAAPQHASQAFISSNLNSSKGQAWHAPLPSFSPTPQGSNPRYESVPPSPIIIPLESPVPNWARDFAPPQPSHKHESSFSSSTSPHNPHRQPSSFASTITKTVKQVVPYSAMIALTLSTILAGGVLAAGIDQAVNGPYSDGVVGLVFAIVFVLAWLIVSILLLIMLTKRTLRRRHNKGS